MTERWEGVRGLAERWAAKHPVKASMALKHIDRDRERLRLKANRTEADETELTRLNAMECGYIDGLRGKWCLRCGRPLRDTTQPGYELGYGPECFEKLAG